MDIIKTKNIYDVDDVDLIKVHPVYKDYGCNIENSDIINLKTKRILKRSNNNGYMRFSMFSKYYSSHRFIWECFNNCIIPEKYEIDHINKNKSDNDIFNLRCITMQQNRKDRDHHNISLIAQHAYELKRCIKATNIETNDIICFKSKNQCGKYFKISASMVLYKINQQKFIKTEKGNFTFDYVNECDITNLFEFPHGRIKLKSKVA